MWRVRGRCRPVCPTTPLNPQRWAGAYVPCAVARAAMGASSVGAEGFSVRAPPREHPDRVEAEEVVAIAERLVGPRLPRDGDDRGARARRVLAARETALGGAPSGDHHHGDGGAVALQDRAVGGARHGGLVSALGETVVDLA
jgi:hypothetical protein